MSLTCARAIPVDEDIVKPELEDEDLKLFLYLQVRLVGLLLRKDVKAGDSAAIHLANADGSFENMVAGSELNNMMAGERRVEDEGTNLGSKDDAKSRVQAVVETRTT